MNVRLIRCLSLIGAIVLPCAPMSASEVKRYAIIVGANSGGFDRPMLRYAVTDAQRFGQVMAELGGLVPDNTIMLKQPALKDLVEAFDTLSRRVAADRQRAAVSDSGRSEVLLYYSGHADEKGLLLGDDRYSYQSVRERLAEIPADVRIAILDACASGTFTRLKGGRVQRPFLVDESVDVRGHAFLTSSAATEAAQESDRIGASYFTHYLVSGLRGAADASGDGKVTLNEAYQFVFNETLGRTVKTAVGAQHPSYDINLSGSGELVMTEVRETSATLVLSEELEGRFFVRKDAQTLVAELSKPHGRRVELAVEPGDFEVRLDRDGEFLLARTKVAMGERVTLEASQFEATIPEPQRRRGSEPVGGARGGRDRVAAIVGATDIGNSATYAALTNRPSYLANLGVQYTRYLREDLAATLDLRMMTGSQSIKPEVARATLGSDPVYLSSYEDLFTGDYSLTQLFAGIRWYPGAQGSRTRTVKPFLAVGTGPVLGRCKGKLNTRHVYNQGSSMEYWDEPVSRSRTTIGGEVGAGLEVLAARSWSLEFAASYFWTGTFGDAIGGRDRYRGFSPTITMGWVFDRGY
jgi:hypothetical protein